MYLQVLSAVVRHFTRGMAPVSMVCKAKTPAHAWGVTSSEVRDFVWQTAGLSVLLGTSWRGHSQAIW